MIRAGFRIASALVCASLLAGCGLTSSPAEGLTFKPPSKWQPSPGIMGFMQFWKPAASDSEVLMLFKSPKQLDPSEVFSSAKLKNGRIERQQSIKICGNQPAVFFKAVATSSTGTTNKDDDVQMVMTNANGTTYFAMYLYPVKTVPNTEAVAALRELCSKT